MHFLDQYESGGPVLAVTADGYRSLIMGFVRLADGVAWCSDGVLNSMNFSASPFHRHFGPVTQHGWALRCDDASFMPIDPWHRYAFNHWKEAVRIVPGMIDLRRKMEAELRAEYADGY